jgi:hypothetical protein
VRANLIETIIFLHAQLILQFAGAESNSRARAATAGPSLEIMKGAFSLSRIHTAVGGKTGRMLVNKDHPWNEIVLYWQLSIILAAQLLSLLYHYDMMKS